MANWYGIARSNYVLVKELQSLRRALEPWPISIHKKHADDSDFDVYVCFLSDEQDSGGWPTICWMDGDDDETEFDPVRLICPHMAEGQVLVMMESGAEKLRYITGHAVAYTHDGREVHVDLTDIYSKAADAFGVGSLSITECSD